MSTGSRRAKVLAVLRSADGPLSIATIAESLGVHVNTVRFHLDALLDTGQVERVVAAPDKPGRPAQLFRASRTMDPGGQRHYRLLAETLVDTMANSPDPVAHASAAGRAMGAQLGAPQRKSARRQPVRQLAVLLTELGFEPEVPSADEIRLRHCPFLEIAREHPDVVCSVHLGLMQGAMADWAAPVTVEELTPFAEPDVCVARLAGAVR